ncbi:RE1 [Symbiodinium pilosum]|uniref:RE1 protein n=1 Tax=Symbiodinium pilosum TaxID=2952 RepID=A0A812YQC7_SYMPI|nr:RE1 [Symbiodinium pilosum]
MGPVTECGETRAADLPLPNLPPSPEVLEYSPDALGNTLKREDSRSMKCRQPLRDAGDEVPDHEMASASAPEFYEVPVPEDDDDLLLGDTECFLAFPDQRQVWEMTLRETQADMDNLPSAQQALEYVLLATPERKKRVEVRMQDLSEGERDQFSQAKGKEARLVVLGFEDPGLNDTPNDAPTLGKDARQLILQKVASNRSKLINFDISTAFLQGRGDGRKLGIHPPEEIRQALDMKPGDQCQLMGGAYGRIDAPFLWFKTLKGTLESLSFTQSPFDACTFSLITQHPQGRPKVHGVLGIHMDDGLRGGDSYFRMVIQKLRDKYSCGSYDEGEFTFTGIHFRQWDDGSIEYDQQEYLDRIQPAHIPRNRRCEPESPLRPDEVHELRRLNGSIQYAAVHTPPDLAAKVGMLQSAVPKAKILHLIEASRLLHEAKSNHVSLMTVPFPEQHVAFCTFSDASFASSRDSNSYQGTLVVATDWRMLANEKAVIVPMVWSSRKIARVVRSTLSAEVVSLCNSVDRMSCLRLFWEWMKDPSVDISQPDEVLKGAPQAALVTDCKSAYDIATKTAVPSCSELRTQLECLLFRERLLENCQMRWVHSKAMLADCLTKTMDSSELRRCLASGQYSPYDEDKVLAERQGRRQSLEWLRKDAEDASAAF